MTHFRRIQAAGTLILALFLARAACAEQPLSGEPESTVRLASEKLFRGIVNTATGVGEIIRQPIVCVSDEGAVGLPVGIINGVFMSFLRTGVGLLEVASFPLPLSDSLEFRCPLNPTYVWQSAD